VTQVAHLVTPKLLDLFANHHSDCSLGNELIALFKIWCRFEQCQPMFVETFIPFILEIVGKYFNQTQGNNPSATEQIETQVIDSLLLKHCLDLLCNILKNVKDADSKQKVVKIFPNLLDYIEQSEDMVLLLQGTITLKIFIHLASE
jgi:hypothetical protein